MLMVLLVTVCVRVPGGHVILEMFQCTDSRRLQLCEADVEVVLLLSCLRLLTFFKPRVLPRRRACTTSSEVIVMLPQIIFTSGRRYC